MHLCIPKEESLFSFSTGLPPTNSNYLTTTLTKSNSEILKWHYQLGHLNIRALTFMKYHDLVIGLPSLKSDLPLYKGCLFGKQSKNSYPIDYAKRAIITLALIHADLCGPMSTPSLGGALYFLLFIDDFSKYTSIYFLFKKSTVFLHFQDYKSLVENHFDN